MTEFKRDTVPEPMPAWVTTDKAYAGYWMIPGLPDTVGQDGYFKVTADPSGYNVWGLSLWSPGGEPPKRWAYRTFGRTVQELEARHPHIRWYPDHDRVREMEVRRIAQLMEAQRSDEDEVLGYNRLIVAPPPTPDRSRPERPARGLPRAHPFRGVCDAAELDPTTPPR